MAEVLKCIGMPQIGENVFVEDNVVYREHYPNIENCILTSGSKTVYVNGKGIGRIGDPMSCVGLNGLEISKTVFAG